MARSTVLKAVQKWQFQDESKVDFEERWLAARHSDTGSSSVRTVALVRDMPRLKDQGSRGEGERSQRLA